MRAWYLLLGAHDFIFRDRRWPLPVRIDTCRLLMRKMLELGPLKPLPEAAEKELVSKAKA
jgi:hypothetical protein